MDITTYATANSAAHAAARHILTRIHAHPALVVGLPTGSTPIPMYRSLVRAAQRGQADFSRVTTFNLDEFLGLGRGDAGSYRTFMEQHFFSQVNIHPRRAHVLDGHTRNWRDEVQQYEARIARAGGLDLVVLGIGRNGHLGFNEPGPMLHARTHRVRLTETTRRANAGLFDDDWTRVPAYALSMGIGTLLAAREVLLIATGAAKARIVAAALRGPITTQVPASLLQAHPRVSVRLDREAASAL